LTGQLLLLHDEDGFQNPYEAGSSSQPGGFRRIGKRSWTWYLLHHLLQSQVACGLSQ